jgi:uncharacterized protein
VESREHRHRDRRPGRLLLTGSADVFALPRYCDALTGRVESVTLRPYSQGELLGRREDFVSWAFSSAPPPPLAPVADLPELIEEIPAPDNFMTES